MGKGFTVGAGALLIMGCLSSCAQLKAALSLEPSRGEALANVDTLLGRIEHVYVECERAELRVAEATVRLHKLVGTDFSQDATLTFIAFQEAISTSQQQAEMLAASLKPLEASAKSFFENWQSDLEKFKSPKMRKRSEKRLVETRNRYRDIISAVGPAVPMFESFNAALNDHALYLQNDFNASAVSDIEGEVRTLTEVAKTLTLSFQEAREASRVYVEHAALRGQLVAPEDVAPKSTAPKSTANGSATNKD